jgi:LysM repeat protein
MCIAGVRSWAQMGRPTTNGKAMIGRIVHPLGVTCLSALVLLAVGCGSTPSAGTGISEQRVPVATPVRDRELELTTLRTEMATTRIAAAKKEAELQELRDLVKQLRLENAESRQAFLELRDRAEQRHVEAEKAQAAQARQAQGHATEDLSALKETVVTLAQELGQLRQDLAKPVAKEAVHPLKPSSSKSLKAGQHAPQSDSPQLVPAARQPASLPSVLSPMALTVTAAVPDLPSTITVQAGDTLASLAKRHRTTVEALRTRNALTSDALIMGRELILPTSPQP